MLNKYCFSVFWIVVTYVTMVAVANGRSMSDQTMDSWRYYQDSKIVENSAMEGALSILRRIDDAAASDDYSEIYWGASPIVRDILSEVEFYNAMKISRSELGVVEARKVLKSTVLKRHDKSMRRDIQVEWDDPSFVDRPFVEVHFYSKFYSGKSGYSEVVSLEKDAYGEWQMIGYHVNRVDVDSAHVN